MASEVSPRNPDDGAGAVGGDAAAKFINHGAFRRHGCWMIAMIRSYDTCLVWRCEMGLLCVCLSYHAVVRNVFVVVGGASFGITRGQPSPYIALAVFLRQGSIVPTVFILFSTTTILLVLLQYE